MMIGQIFIYCDRVTKRSDNRRVLKEGTLMKKITIMINQFGLPQAINRPRVPATKELDLSGDAGQQRIAQDMTVILRKFARTFARLEKM